MGKTVVFGQFAGEKQSQFNGRIKDPGARRKKLKTKPIWASPK
jgi:hypothetical protein